MKKIIMPALKDMDKKSHKEHDFKKNSIATTPLTLTNKSWQQYTRRCGCTVFKHPTLDSQIWRKRKKRAKIDFMI